jgi:hypothetical protein
MMPQHLQEYKSSKKVPVAAIALELIKRPDTVQAPSKKLLPEPMPAGSVRLQRTRSILSVYSKPLDAKIL